MHGDQALLCLDVRNKLTDYGRSATVNITQFLNESEYFLVALYTLGRSIGIERNQLSFLARFLISAYQGS